MPPKPHVVRGCAHLNGLKTDQGSAFGHEAPGEPSQVPLDVSPFLKLFLQVKFHILSPKKSNFISTEG